jgi:glyoxylate/succinic semialdehyde reductase
VSAIHLCPLAWRRDQLGQALPVAAAANEQFKAARAKGRGDEDFAAVYEATQI